MFIYRIDVTTETGVKTYIGLDSKDVSKEYRWKDHKRKASSDNPKQHIHRVMKKYGIDKCMYSIVESNFNDLADLALAEISYIKKYDTYNNGLNSSPGGDGIMTGDLSDIPQERIDVILEALSIAMRDYNTSIKWHNKSKSERSELTKHLHTNDIIEKRSQSLKERYIKDPELAKNKGNKIKEWQEKNKEQLRQQNKQASDKAAIVNSIQIKAITPDGDEVIYKNKVAFVKEHGHIIGTILKKTQEGKTHKGWKAWEVK